MFDQDSDTDCHIKRITGSVKTITPTHHSGWISDIQDILPLELCAKFQVHMSVIFTWIAEETDRHTES